MPGWETIKISFFDTIGICVKCLRRDFSEQVHLKLNYLKCVKHDRNSDPVQLQCWLWSKSLGNLSENISRQHSSSSSIRRYKFLISQNIRKMKPLEQWKAHRKSIITIKAHNFRLHNLSSSLLTLSSTRVSTPKEIPRRNDFFSSRSKSRAEGYIIGLSFE